MKTNHLVTILVLSILGIMAMACKDNPHTPEIEERRALFLVWNTENSHKLWSTFEREMSQFIHDMYNQDIIRYVLPFEHKALIHPNIDKSWTGSIIIGLNSDNHKEAARNILTKIKQGSIDSDLVAADLLKLQEGLDMFYSKSGGIEEESNLEQIVEYVFSEPKARAKYYGEQYVYSGPAMKELHGANNAGRFIGYEVEERLYGVDFPAWDLIHVVGFTKEQKKRASPIFMEVWDRHAERAFGKGMTFMKKKGEWDKIRLNIKSDAQQQIHLSLPIKNKKN